jgi:hypothetical protein
LIDRQECLVWLLELVDRTKSWDDPSLDYSLPLVLQFLHEVVQSELISRKLAHTVAQRLMDMIQDNRVTNPDLLSEITSTANVKGSCAPISSSVAVLAATLSELSSCPYHRRTFLSFCCILQVRYIYDSLFTFHIIVISGILCI